MPFVFDAREEVVRAAFHLVAVGAMVRALAFVVASDEDGRDDAPDREYDPNEDSHPGSPGAGISRRTAIMSPAF